MKNFYSAYAKPLLFKLDPELAHELTVEMGLKAAQLPILRDWVFQPYECMNLPQLAFTWKGLHFPNRIGLAAGFDKNARFMPLMERLGFGFLEIGSITALQSSGNSKPRLFRLPADYALINRMGLNNDGAEVIMNRLHQFEHKYPIGVNIAKTHSAKILGDAAIEDYLKSFSLAEHIADYITINISCPNTEEGKTFEDPDTLNRLLSVIIKNKQTNKPILVKLSVDLNANQLQELITVCSSYKIDGYVCSNTSSQRFQLKTNLKTVKEIGKGGLSGNPIHQKSVELVRQVKSQQPNSLVIGVGGIDSPESAIHFIDAGADLIQLYTGLIYYGPQLVKDINTAFLNKG
jgi:dihydroorotate dehydrogenase